MVAFGLTVSTNSCRPLTREMSKRSFDRGREKTNSKKKLPSMIKTLLPSPNIRCLMTQFCGFLLGFGISPSVKNRRFLTAPSSDGAKSLWVTVVCRLTVKFQHQQHLTVNLLQISKIRCRIRVYSLRFAECG